MGWWIDFEDQTGQSKTTVTGEVSKSDASRRREGFVVLERVTNFFVPRCCADVVSR